MPLLSVTIPSFPYNYTPPVGYKLVIKAILLQITGLTAASPPCDVHINRNQTLGSLVAPVEYILQKTAASVTGVASWRWSTATDDAGNYPAGTTAVEDISSANPLELTEYDQLVLNLSGSYTWKVWIEAQLVPE